MRYCLALDLKDDPSLISQYDAAHKAVWPEIAEGLRRQGIKEMEIFRVANRLFMIIETKEDFSWERKAAEDAADSLVQQWEALMSQYQQALPWALPGQKWLLMDRIFQL